MIQWLPKRSSCTTVLFYKSKKYIHQDTRLSLRSEGEGNGRGKQRPRQWSRRHSLCMPCYLKYDCFLKTLKVRVIQETLLDDTIKGPFTKTVWDGLFFQHFSVCPIRKQKSLIFLPKIFFSYNYVRISSTGILASWGKILQNIGL